MALNTEVSMTKSFYKRLNEECFIVCRLNEENLNQEQIDVFSQLHEEIRKRYYGTGFVIPELLEGKRILDIGCGTGSFVFILSKLVGPNGYVVGVDICEEQLKTAKSQAEYHWKLWGYEKPNFEFILGNAEKLTDLGLQKNSFDAVVSCGVFCLCPEKAAVFSSTYDVLKEGGQFCLSDVFAEKDPIPNLKDDEIAWGFGLGGAIRWDTLSGMGGFTTPYLKHAASIKIDNEDYAAMIGNSRYLCAGWRLFKIPEGAKRGAARVTYNGNIPDFPDSLCWDVDLTFKTGHPVDVDSELATILSNSDFKDSFTFTEAQDSTSNKRNQNPFAHLDNLKATGQEPDFIFKIE